MNLNRRQFLQMIATVTAAAALPLPVMGEVVEHAQVAVPVDTDLLYAPVTKRNPLCWIELDGVRYDCKSINLKQRVDTLDYWQIMPGMSGVTQRSIRTEITFSAYWSTEIDEGILSKALKVPVAPVPFLLGGIGVDGTLSGEAMCSSASVSCDSDGYVMVDVTMYPLGSITRRRS